MGEERNLILIVSNRCEATADFLERKLRARDCGVLRLNTEDLASAQVTISYRQSGSHGHFLLCADELPLNRVQGIYYRRPVAPSVDAILHQCDRGCSMKSVNSGAAFCIPFQT